jgi:hypothetical protein
MVLPKVSPTERPFFLGGSRKSDPEFLFEQPDCDILKIGDRITLTHTGRVPWTKRHLRLAQKYKVDSVSLRSQSFGKRKSVDFLLDLPMLRGVYLSLDSPIDLSPFTRLPELRRLSIAFGLVWRMGDHLRPVDFSTLSKLEYANVMMCKAFESILRCSTIQELAIHNSHDGRLRDLDLTHLPALRDLVLDHCPKLRSVNLHPKARVRGLELSLCGSYEIDWDRIGPHLRYLLLGGRLTFSLEDILNAPKLEELHTHEIRKLPRLGFLPRLRHLRTVFIFSAPPGPKITKKDWEVINQINARGRRESSKSGSSGMS